MIPGGDLGQATLIVMRPCWCMGRRSCCVCAKRTDNRRAESQGIRFHGLFQSLRRPHSSNKRPFYSFALYPQIQPIKSINP
jgi:hypothetical protein